MLLAGRQGLLDRITADDILTPHPGEAATLLGCSAADVQADRQGALERLRDLCRGVIILKGAASLIGQADAPTLLCPYDVPQLAVGGSGDVLAGCAGGLLARLLPSMQTAKEQAQVHNNTANQTLTPSHMLAGQAAALHALAGKSIAEQWPLRGNTPSAVADALPQTLSACMAASESKDDILPWPR